MKILFIVPYYKPAYIYGGPIVVISLLAENLVALGHDVTIYSTTANGKTELDTQPNKEVVVDGVRVMYFNRVTKNNTYVAPRLWSFLSKTATDFDVIHIHTWWNFLVLGAVLICKRKGIKPILSPHGMLSDYIFFKRHAFAKKWIHKLIGKKLLKSSWLHVSTELEWDESRNIVPGWEGIIIANMIKLSENEHLKQNNEIFSMGFLSRIDPKKGLDVLIKALALIKLPYKLFVAGAGEVNYVNSLKHLASELGNAEKIEWVGWKNGEEKFDFLAEMDLFALTSHSENFAIVVIESLSVGTPVLISNNVGLYSYVNKTAFGIVTDMHVGNIAKAIEGLMTNDARVKEINAIAPGVIKSEYAEVSLVKQYIGFYNSTQTV